MKDSFWFRHDANADDDGRMMRVLAKFGNEGIGVYWRLAQILRTQHKLPVTEIQTLAYHLRYDQLRPFVTDACESGLFKCDDNFFWSDRMLAEIEAYEASIAQRSTAGRSSAAKRSFNARSTAVEQPFNDSSTQDRTGQNRTKKEKTAAEPPEFTEFYSEYPRHVSHGKALEAYRRAIKTTSPGVIIAGVRRYVAQITKLGTKPEFVKHPATWLNGECWADEDGKLSLPKPTKRIKVCPKCGAKDMIGRCCTECGWAYDNDPREITYIEVPA